MTKTFNSKKYGTLTVTMQRRNSNYYFYTDKPITNNEASLVQLELNYHPAGYGFYGFKSDHLGSTWHCFNSCD